MANLSVPKPTPCVIVNKDLKVSLEAHFNPKELTINKSIRWNPHKTTSADSPLLEFTDGDPKVLSFELLFDTFEEGVSVYSKYVKKLESFAEVIEPLQRPPHLTFSWGSEFPAFTGVIESLSVKYTMFFNDGTPCRATCSVTIKQAKTVEGKTPANVPGTADGSATQVDPDSSEAKYDRKDPRNGQLV